MISIVTLLQARMQTLKSKESKNVHKLFINRSHGVHKRKVYYNQKGKEANKMKKQNVKIEFDGNLYDRDLIVSYMRDDLREKLHSEWTDEKGGEQEFFETYCELLYNETGEEFET